MAEHETINETGSQETKSNGSQNEIYHERQSKQLCALHALNNLFQNREAFTKKELDEICFELAPDSKLFNPHRSALGLGCYDINVIISALAKKGYGVIWFDKRKEPHLLNLDRIFGFILNVPNKSSNGFFSAPLNYLPVQAQIWSSQKHWIAIRKIAFHYYNLDSKLATPFCIGGEKNLLLYLSMKNSVEQVETFIVVPKSVEEDQSWFKMVL